MTPAFKLVLMFIGLGLGIPLCISDAWLPGLTFLALGVGSLLRIVKEILDIDKKGEQS